MFGFAMPGLSLPTATGQLDEGTVDGAFTDHPTRRILKEVYFASYFLISIVSQIFDAVLKIKTKEAMSFFKMQT
ncbi:MAG: hypothetical protein IJ599_00960 [Alphaproteobacteria bacterium]|nr:hypothetical protein [Alphaproteobacteria bacterium]